MYDVERKTGFGVLPYLYGGLTGVAIGLIVVAGVLFFRASDGSSSPVQASNRTAQPSVEASPAGGGVEAARVTTADITADRHNAIVVASERVAPAVVSITATVKRRVQAFDFFNRFAPRYRTESSRGSGVILQHDGYILTNYHVIGPAENIRVTLYTGETLPASYIGGDPSYDLALLKIDGTGYPHAELGDSDDLVVGEWVIAIGSPLGNYLVDTQPTVTVGVVSAFHRDIKQDPNSTQIFNDMIQTDAAINPGNSGGPLVNARGEVIGINTFIFSGSGGSIGMGFAIPINRGVHVLEELISFGRVRQVWMGMTAANITAPVKLALRLERAEGAFVREIYEDGPADRAGFKAGDIILAIDGQTIHNVDHANRIVFGSRVGDTLRVTVLRDGKEMDIDLTLDERPEI